jgi:hypothetical protein
MRDFGRERERDDDDNAIINTQDEGNKHTISRTTTKYLADLQAQPE